MKVEGTYTFDAPQQAVWDALQDPDMLVAVMPGAQSLDPIGENEYASVMKVKVGPVGGKFKSTIKIEDMVPPDSYTMHVTSKAPIGQAKATGQVQLAAGEEDNTTEMTYSGEANIGGRIASVGQRLIDATAKSIIGKSLDQLNEQIKAKLAEETDS